MTSLASRKSVLRAGELYGAEFGLGRQPVVHAKIVGTYSACPRRRWRRKQWRWVRSTFNGFQDVARQAQTVFLLAVSRLKEARTSEPKNAGEASCGADPRLA